MFSKRLKVSFLIVGLAASMGMGVLVGFWMPADDDLFQLRKNFEIFGAVYEELVTGYVEDLDPEQLMHVGMDAMLSELDPYTTFIDEGQQTDIRVLQQGSYGGVGLNVGKRGGNVTVIAPVEGASGYKQGVRAGDVITQIEQQPVDSLTVTDVETLLRGEPGTTVEVQVERAGAPAPITFTLTRRKIDLNSVPHRGFVGRASDGVGYVKLERFTRGAGGDVQAAIEALQEKRALTGLVLDLRDNPGGLLREAVKLVELFVPQGSEIVSTRGRLAKAERSYRSDRAPVLPDLPLVVLVNGLSASASEIVAGAVQDLDRGVVMGTTTYGKGLVQVVRALPHNTSLKMTTAEYYTPSGRSIQSVDYTASDSVAIPDSLRRSFTTARGRRVRDQQGIRPDKVVPANRPSELEEALRRRAAFFLYANHYAAQRDRLPDDFAVTDAVLGDFRTWLDDKAFAYPTDAEQAVGRLQQQLDAADYEGVRDELRDLRAAVEQEKADGFTQHAAALKQHLEQEILARFVPKSQQIEASLSHDTQVQEAAALLQDGDRYESILNPAE
jgi:carboxyl-terminal processing protease